MHENDLLLKYSPSEITEALLPLLTEARIKRIEEVLAKRIGSVQIAIEAPTDPHNAIATIRTAEAMGLYHMHLIATEFRKKRRTTCGANRWVALNTHRSLDEFLKKVEGVTLLGASPTGNVPLEELPIDRPICLMFGNEYRGLSPQAITACHSTFSIPMYGMVESYNLSVSAALTMQSVMGRLREDTCGDLSKEALAEIRARYYMRTIGLDTAQLVLTRSSSESRLSDSVDPHFWCLKSSLYREK